MKKSKMDVQGKEVAVIAKNNDDYISLTDIARYRDKERTDYIIQNWIRSRTTIEYLGIWEQLNNPDFNSIEFDGFRKQAISQLVCLSNLENLNAHFIEEGVPQTERLEKLNKIAIHQMKLLIENRTLKKLERN
ncbi:MAG TPA: KilA-N domain-containing protein [bacterium]|nr:KilA-N domain-containing protein [bacterium]HOG43745.1 KilA-N domain-containing protein [bacterium]HQB09248.1 KilA-N domain-containing protein [bacterium]HQM84789.1 KilA-N domain-containing protein [bacterium]